MIELYLLEQAIRAERELLDHESARRAACCACGGSWRCSCWPWRTGWTRVRS
jgi:hypothetical protein